MSVNNAKKVPVAPGSPLATVVPLRAKDVLAKMPNSVLRKRLEELLGKSVPRTDKKH